MSLLPCGGALDGGRASQPTLVRLPPQKKENSWHTRRREEKRSRDRAVRKTNKRSWWGSADPCYPMTTDKENEPFGRTQYNTQLCMYAHTDYCVYVYRRGQKKPAARTPLPNITHSVAPRAKARQDPEKCLPLNTWSHVMRIPRDRPVHTYVNTCTNRDR
ncbi:hypothetical protein GGS23DRAFT_378531 [Durotheca rogersii]|uniref:uncharacterized protein n=1 Tax=Durotheca rogersii TaxID=419775 RepID=UPI00221F2467|nr:uncharacterized protein GGS23DRAFT_378531 [Durotheca rogersii]KAI5866284.1 hypothetical protein GGS23DRAFT_378531 [Durotheca rogersii]